MNEFFSVIIPTLNERNYLPLLLTDLITQREKNFEVIVVDAQSTDHTKDIANSFGTKIPIRFYDVTKGNVAHQRNMGAHYARGNYLVFLDADVRLTRGFLTRLKREIQKGQYFIYIPAIYPQNRAFQDKMLFKAINFIIEASQFTTRPLSSSGSMIFHREFFLLLGGFDEKLFLSEDHEIVQRAKNRGITAKFLKDAIIKFSLRRLKKEGRLDVFRKYLIASFYNIRASKIDKKIFEYPMGGGYYDGIDVSRSSALSPDKQLRAYLNKFKTKLEQLFTE